MTTDEVLLDDQGIIEAPPALAMDKIGPHLLGRKAAWPDDRRWPLAAFLETGSATPLELAAALVAKSHAALAVRDWVALATPLIVGVSPAPVPPAPPTPAPTPAPTPSGAVNWPDSEQLDQAQTNHCVGFGCAQFGNTRGADGVDDHYLDADGHKIYYAAKVIDGEPKQENGSSIFSGAQALLDMERIKGYAQAKTLDEIKQWVIKFGPVVVGTDWYDGMFTPDANGFVFPTGTIAGGHCYIITGYDPETDVFTLQNSWGTGWGINGLFYMHAANFNSLFDQGGDAWTAVELAVAA